MRDNDLGGPARLRVDPTACDGIGMCAHLAPDLIVLDTWGYPIIAGRLSRMVRRTKSCQVKPLEVV
jgi:ferredoxin